MKNVIQSIASLHFMFSAFTVTCIYILHKEFLKIEMKRDYIEQVFTLLPSSGAVLSVIDLIPGDPLWSQVSTHIISIISSLETMASYV